MKELANTLEDMYRALWTGDLDRASDLAFDEMNWKQGTDKAVLIVQRCALDILRDAREGRLSPNGLSALSELQKLAEFLAAREG